MPERAPRRQGRVRMSPWAGPYQLNREGATSAIATPTIPHDADIVSPESQSPAWIVLADEVWVTRSRAVGSL